jgi:hypothetical protein
MSQTEDGRSVRFEDPLLDTLAGEWHLTRKIGTRVAENRVRAGWILAHQFFRIDMIDVETPPEYEALVLIGYEHADRRYVAYWLDVFGGKFSEKGFGIREGDSIRFEFPYPDGAVRNTFAWNAAAGTWGARIEQQDVRGRWSLFAEDTLRRSP